MVLVKPGVVFKKFYPCCTQFIDILLSFSGSINTDMVITSANDSKHADNSRHYKDKAWDVRSWNMTADQKHKFVQFMDNYLSDDYKVLFEDTIKDNQGNIIRGEHYHVEWTK